MNEVVSLNMANPNAADRIGSIAALVGSTIGEERYFLTCSHVALGGSAQDKGGIISSPENISILEQRTRIAYGQLVYARLNGTVDVALVQVNAPLNSRRNSLPGGGSFMNPINRSLLKVNQKVGFYSSLRKELIWGKVVQIASEESIILNYGLANRIFKGLTILTSSSGLNSLSTKGDSGSLLFTEDLKPFGMLIGGGTNRDYAIPLTDLFTLTKTKFILTP